MIIDANIQKSTYNNLIKHLRKWFKDHIKPKIPTYQNTFVA